MVKYTLSKINRVKYTHACLVAWQNLTPKTKYLCMGFRHNSLVEYEWIHSGYIYY